ncbi:WhiB family transcriptional regulator [Streptomyces sp. NPDC020667]|uniref:WhiB family transcriptional regulator n=1 Tax=Streptomyces sp. NPDC020667 TaxID=3154895 RepID=UPI0033FB7079
MNWRQHAACRDEDPELFFPIGTRDPARTQAEAAKSVCRRCPVVEQCLTWALRSGQEYGIWGCTTESERRALHRARQAAGPARPGRGVH